MIVQRRAGELLLIRQTDHAALSGVLAEHWGAGAFARPEPRASMLVAAARHDNGWREWEEAPRVNPATRRPYNFTEMPVGEHFPFYLRGIDGVVRDDPYAGLLVCLHLGGLYRKRYGLDPGLGLERFPPDVRPVVEDYLRHLDEKQKQLQERLGRDGLAPAEMIEGPAVWTNYRLLQVYDLFSLYFCMAPLREYTLRHVPVSASQPDTEIKLHPAGGEALAVDPYPFDTAPLRVAVSARVVPDRDYDGDKDLRAALAGAPETALRFELRGRSVNGASGVA
jgi:hypothetical protein